MKKLIGAILALVITSYCSLWWYTAGELKTTTVAQIQHLNQIDGIHFSYDQLKISGFPWRVAATFENAKLIVSPTPNTRPMISDKTLIEFEHPLTLNASLLSKTATLNFNKIHITRADQSITQEGRRTLSATFFSTRSFNAPIKNIKAIAFARERIHATDQDHKNQVIAQPLQISLSRTQLGHDQERYQMHIDEHYADEVTPHQMLINSVPLLSLFAATDPNTKAPQVTTENNLIKADFAVETFSLPTLIRWLSLGQVGEIYLSDELTHKPPMIDINNLTVRTPWFSWQAKFHGDIHRKLDHNNVHLTLHSQFTMAPVGQHILDQLLNKATIINTNQEVRSSIQSLFPNLVHMGTIQCDGELNSTAHKLMIKDLNLSNQHYGIKGNLFVRHAHSGSAEFELRNYTHMVDDAVAYVTTLNKLVNHLKINDTTITFTPQFNKHVITSLKKFSTTPDADDKNITLKVRYDGQQFLIGEFDQVAWRQELLRLKQYVKINQTQPLLSSDPLPYINDQSFLEGMRYQSGHGHALDNQRAAKLYQLAINNTGDDRAMNNLAVLKAQGKGVKQDINAAIDLLQNAIELGNPIAELNLHNLQHQRGNAALIHYTSAFSYSVTCKEYDQQAIDNMLDVFKVMHWQEIVFIRAGQPGAMPDKLREYAHKKAVNLGLTVLRG